MITQEFDLNLIPDSEPVVVHVNQYDEGAGRFIIHLYNGDVAYTPTNATVKIQGTKPDKKGFQYYAQISGSTVTADVNIQMTAVAGKTPTQVIVEESSGTTGTFRFTLDVQESALTPTVDVSETDLPAIIEGAEADAERAEQAAADAQGWATHGPYIDPETSHWWVWDETQHEFVDTGISADGSTTSYSSLSNKPQIEGNELVGNKTAAQLGIQKALEWNGNYLVI